MGDDVGGLAAGNSLVPRDVGREQIAARELLAGPGRRQYLLRVVRAGSQAQFLARLLLLLRSDHHRAGHAHLWIIVSALHRRALIVVAHDDLITLGHLIRGQPPRHIEALPLLAWICTGRGRRRW